MKTPRRDTPLRDYVLEDGSREIHLRDVKKGDYVSPRRVISVGVYTRANKVYIKGDYDRSSGRYSLIDCDDINRELFVRGTDIVLVGFTY